MEVLKKTSTLLVNGSSVEYTITIYPNKFSDRDLYLPSVGELVHKIKRRHSIVAECKNHNIVIERNCTNINLLNRVKEVEIEIKDSISLHFFNMYKVNSDIITELIENRGYVKTKLENNGEQ